jgi:hypothetical protein
MRPRRLPPWSTFALVLAAACGHPAAVPTPIVANTAPAPAAPPKPRPASTALLAWPVAPFSPAQIAEAKSCDAAKLAGTRYPKALAVDALPGAFAPHGSCDQATLAAACAGRVKDGPLPATCLDAYRAAVTANPAFAFVSSLPGQYFGQVALVAAPPAAGHALASVVLDYKWGGLGEAVDWTLTIRDATSKPSVAVTGSSAKAAKSSPELGAKVAALGTSLESFLPIPGQLEAIDCTDNYPDWTATLGFDDGEKLELSTHRSNLLGLGGPWQTTIAGVTYLQLAPGFTQAVADLTTALGLPIGEPMGAMCRGYNLEDAVLAPPTK